jgi:hypothetical protein
LHENAMPCEQHPTAPRSASAAADADLSSPAPRDRHERDDHHPLDDDQNGFDVGIK